MSSPRSVILSLLTLASRSLDSVSALRRGAPGQQALLPYRQQLASYADLQYHASIEVGGQSMEAIFDTGSFDLLVLSERCRICVSPAYDHTASLTFRPWHGNASKNETAEVNHTFGSGPTTSLRGFEQVRVGPLVAKNTTFYEITSHNITALDNASFDAIVGIGPGKENGSYPSLLESLKIDEYSICLGRKPLSPGWITWGGGLTPAQKLHDAALLRVVGTHHWAVSMTELLPVTSNLTTEQRLAAETLLCGKGCAAVLDSGTSLISAPSHSIEGLNYLLPKLHENCSNFADVPSLDIVLGGRRLRLPPEAFTIRLRGTPSEKLRAAQLLQISSLTSSTSGTNQIPGLEEDLCAYAFMPSNAHTDYGPLWVFGMPFFRAFHVTFRPAEKVEDRKIWLAEATEDCSPGPLQTEKGDDGNRKYEGMGVYRKMIVAQRSQTLHAPRLMDAKMITAPRLRVKGAL